MVTATVTVSLFNMQAAVEQSLAVTVTVTVSLFLLALREAATLAQKQPCLINIASGSI